MNKDRDIFIIKFLYKTFLYFKFLKYDERSENHFTHDFVHFCVATGII